MPYRIRKAPKRNLYWVIGKDGTKHSNEPLPLERAKRQLTALNIAHAKKSGGAWYDVFNPKKVVNEFVNPDSVLRRGVKKVTNEIVNPDSIVRRRITDVSRGIRVDYPPSSRRTIEKYGDWMISDLVLRRDPIQSALHVAFQFVTLGQWNKARAAENKDKLFHLGIVLTVNGPNNQKAAIVVEKNEVINVGLAKPVVDGTEMVDSPAPQGLTLSGFLERGLGTVGPDRFFKYDPFKNNCQDFVALLLRANGVYGPTAEAFVKQDINGLLSKLPGWTGAVAKGITDLGGLANVAVEGGKRGAKKYCMPLKDLVSEHRELVKVLKEGKPKPLAAMAKRQSKEFQHYLQMYNRMSGGSKRREAYGDLEEPHPADKFLSEAIQNKIREKADAEKRKRVDAAIEANPRTQAMAAAAAAAVKKSGKGKGSVKAVSGGNFPPYYKKTIQYMYRVIGKMPMADREKLTLDLLEYIIQKNQGTTTYELQIQNEANELHNQLTEQGVSIDVVWADLTPLISAIKSDPPNQIPTTNPPYPSKPSTGMGRRRSGSVSSSSSDEEDESLIKMAIKFLASRI